LSRYLTKSRFKQALECPTKLSYTKKKQYPSSKNEDTFLQSLAEGGFQVEELARMNYPQGIGILGDDWKYEELVKRTSELLELENVTIFEAAFLHNGLFIRVDILDKKGDDIELIEVKAKSISKKNHIGFFTKRGHIESGWIPYLYDVAFQEFVIEKAYPSWNVKSYLLLANKDAASTVDGINQFFRISKNSKFRTGVLKQENLKLEDLGAPLLAKIRVEEEIDYIRKNNPADDSRSFIELVEYYKDHYSKDVKIFTEIGVHCKQCEYRCEESDELKSGFNECWSSQLKVSSEQLKKPKIYDISGFRKAKKLMEGGKYFMEDLTEYDINPQPISDKFSSTERQWIQVEKEVNNDPTPVIELDGLRNEMNSWVYPLNFIDFETSAIALPYTKGRKPYEQLAFQYSHHIVYEDGRIEHASEYLNTEVGAFPNFDFIRALKTSLESNNGSIFRYHNHENTILNAIYEQLLDSREIDKESLIEFIHQISHNRKNCPAKWCGNRDMIDLWKVAKDYYYNPYTRGSNSIKDLLPAVLHSSEFLQDKYQKSIGEINLTSKNFNMTHVFLVLENNTPMNPYKLLPPLFEGWDPVSLDRNISEIEAIDDGGAALVAYGKLQFEDVSLVERKEIENALLKYCELDTLAMVMIYECFREIVN